MALCIPGLIQPTNICASLSPLSLCLVKSTLPVGPRPQTSLLAAPPVKYGAVRLLALTERRPSVQPTTLRLLFANWLCVMAN